MTLVLTLSKAKRRDLQALPEDEAWRSLAALRTRRMELS